MPSFAAIGLDHRHIYDLTAGLLAAGAKCVGYNPDTTDPRVLASFRKRFPDVPGAETERLLDDPSIDFVVISAVPRDRAELAIAAMRRGKDVMADKPGVTTLAQLLAVQQAAEETGRLWSVGLGRLMSPAVQAALQVVRSGEIGRLVQLTSPAPHRGHTSRMLHSAVDFLGVEAVVVLYALIVISPFALLGGLAWALYRMRRRREEQRLLVA
jgi:predicted dehydrogenase